ncbi:type II toxin-antitoxin system RelE/ParE family toxin [Bradyrhizobium sp. CCBAU 51627]|uniref:type II toxin-antitoxin system RelE/ParE family toxin n=1 Tax=Bradyrhizobium sp. CCBAU 51627 TaxID=1325088 RepID=UPI003FA4A0C9
MSPSKARGALTLLHALREKCESLADAPRGYPLVPRYEHKGIRRRPFGNYLIFYRIGRDCHRQQLQPVRGREH